LAPPPRNFLPNLGKTLLKERKELASCDRRTATGAIDIPFGGNRTFSVRAPDVISLYRDFLGVAPLKAQIGKYLCNSRAANFHSWQIAHSPRHFQQIPTKGATPTCHAQ
jgi:hypothetical protein